MLKIEMAYYAWNESKLTDREFTLVMEEHIKELETVVTKITEDALPDSPISDTVQSLVFRGFSRG